MPLPWLIGIAVEEATSGASAKVFRIARGSDALRALERATDSSIKQFLSEVSDGGITEFAFLALREGVSLADPSGVASDDLYASLLNGFTQTFKALEEVQDEDGSSHLQAIGIELSADDAGFLLTQLVVQALGQQTPADSPLVGMSTHLRVRQGEELTLRSPVLIRPIMAQARYIHAWISMSDQPPRVTVENRSRSPINDVTPIPVFIGISDTGEELARVGHSPLPVKRQIDPMFAYIWELEHMRLWQGQREVWTQLHLHFTDAAGTSWLLAHDRLSETPNPWGRRSYE